MSTTQHYALPLQSRLATKKPSSDLKTPTKSISRNTVGSTSKSNLVNNRENAISNSKAKLSQTQSSSQSNVLAQSLSTTTGTPVNFILKESIKSNLQQTQSFSKNETIGDIPDSPHKLQVTPQENFQSVTSAQKSASKRQQRSQTKSLPRNKSQGRVQIESPSKPILSPFKHCLDNFEEKLNQEHLKGTIRALSEKIKLYENIEQEKNIVRDQHEQTDLAREELRNNIKETAERVREETDKSKKYQEILIGENSNLSNQILQITEMFTQKVQDYEDMKQAMALQEKNLNVKTVQAESLKDYQDKYMRESQASEDLALKYVQLNETLEHQSQVYKAQVDELVQEKQDLIAENKDVKFQLSLAQQEINTLKEQVDLTRAALQQTEALLSQERAKTVSLTNIKELNQHLTVQLSQEKAEREALEQRLQQTISDNSKINQRLREEYERIAEERNTVNSELNELFAEKSEKDIMIKNLSSENFELNGRMIALEQLLCAKEDSDSKFDMLNEALRKLEANKEKYKSDLETCTNYLLEVEEKCQEAQNTSLELLQQLKDRECEIERLQDIIIHLQNNTDCQPKLFMYQPVKDDPIDKKLADYINSAPSQVRQKMTFVREAEGIYKYGKKRVFMKIEKDSIIIRVGGGYLTIDEFIEQYCQCEDQKKKLFSLIYSGQCQGSKDFKTFYFTQKTMKDKVSEGEEKDTASEDLQEELVDEIGEEEEEE